MTEWQPLLLEDRHRARPAGGGAADLVREAGDGEAMAGQRLEIVQLLEVAVADVAAGFVALPDDRRIVILGPFLGGEIERRVPAPGVGAGPANALLAEGTGGCRSPCPSPKSRGRCCRSASRRAC